jgi:hypothetical protein
MTSEIADRLAKLLRLACSTGPDGEKLAAIGRLSAIAAAQDIDWDQALANGSGPALTEEQMSRIFWEGHARGVAETEQRLRPARDWTPADNTSAEVGSDSTRLSTILDAALKAEADGLLSDWEIDFTTGVRARFNDWGHRLYVSEKMWKSLDKLETKLRRMDLID